MSGQAVFTYAQVMTPQHPSRMERVEALTKLG
jgi:hypothetical protein